MTPASSDDTNYDIWLEHSSAKVPYRLARDENGSVMLSTGSAPFTSQQIFTGSFGIESVNANVDSPISFENWDGGAGFTEVDLTQTGMGQVYSYAESLDTSWTGRLYLSPQIQTGATTTQAPIKFLYSSLGLFCITTRYVLEWTGAAWTTRLDITASYNLTDIAEFTNSTATYIVVGVTNNSYYYSTDGVTFTQAETYTTAPSFRASANTSSVSATSIAPSKPTGTLENDIMLAVVAKDNVETVTAPAGWALLSEVDHSSGTANTSFFWKRAGASEASSYAFSWTTADRATAAIASYSGASRATTPYVGFVSNTDSGTSHDTTATTATLGNSKAIVMIGATNDDAGVTTATWTVAAGYDERADPGGGPAIYYADKTVSAGAVATASFTASASIPAAVAVIVLNPPNEGAIDVSRWAIRGQASGAPLLWAVEADGDIRNTANPISSTAWSAADSIVLGEAVTISGLEVVDNVFYLFTSKGITSYDGTTVSTVWNNSTLTLASNAARPYTWVDKAIYFTYDGSIYRYTADSLEIQKIWPRSLQTGHSKLNGTITFITGDGRHIFFGLKNSAGGNYILKMDPYIVRSAGEEEFTPVHNFVYNVTSEAGAAIVVPGSSSTFNSTNPQLVFGRSTDGQYVILPRPNLAPENDTNYLFNTDAAWIEGSWVSGGAKTYLKYLNESRLVARNLAAARYAALYYAIDNGSTALIDTYTTNGLNRTSISTDVEFSRIRYAMELDSNISTSGPIVTAVAFSTSLNPPRKRQWVIHIEISEDSEMLGGGSSRHGARYLDTHLFDGLTKRVKFYDRLGSSYTTKILDIESVVVGEDKDVYKVTLVQL